MILLATVVFPEALPPHNPADPHSISKALHVCFSERANGVYVCHMTEREEKRTDDKRLL